MIVVVNFSHPLNERATQIIMQEYSAGDAEIYSVPVHLDTSTALLPQLQKIANQVLALLRIHGNPANVDCIIPPGQPVASSYLARRFPTANILVMTRSEGVPVQFVPTELIRSLVVEGGNHG